jgi:type II secretory pathway component PulF
MATYTFAARDTKGQMVESWVEAASRYDALAALRNRGLTATRLEEQGSEAQATAKPKAEKKTRSRMRFGSSRAKVTPNEKAVFCRQLAISVGAGVPLR